MKLIEMQNGEVYKVKEKVWGISILKGTFFEFSFKYSKDLERKKFEYDKFPTSPNLDYVRNYKESSKRNKTGKVIE